MIYLKRGSRKVSFEGVSKRISTKFNLQQKQFLTGESFSSHRSKVNKLEIEVRKLSNADFEILELMFFDSSTTEKFTITTEDNKEYYMIVEGNSLNLTPSDTDNYSRFWTGVIKMTE